MLLRLWALENRLDDIQARISDPSNSRVMLGVIRDEIVVILKQIESLATPVDRVVGGQASGSTT